MAIMDSGSRRGREVLGSLSCLIFPSLLLPRGFAMEPWWMSWASTCGHVDRMWQRRSCIVQGCFPVLVQTSERNVASTKDQGRKKNKKEQNALEINQKRQHFGQCLKASGQANRQNWKPRHLWQRADLVGGIWPPIHLAQPENNAITVVGAQVSREMGGRRAPRECKVQYARDYRAVTWEARNTRKDDPRCLIQPCIRSVTFLHFVL